MGTHDFHVVYEGISVRPGVGGLAGQRFDVDLLGRVQIVKSFREQVHGIIHQRGFSLKRGES